jgi:16S rRNA (guanine527-N7)-methyltransferase
MGLTDRVDVQAARAEAVAAAVRAGVSPAWDVVTVRAVAALEELVELAMPLLRLGGRLLAWKGAGIDDELEAARRLAPDVGAGPAVIHEGPPIPGLDGHRIVEVRKVAATPPGYPRDPVRRRRGSR